MKINARNIKFAWKHRRSLWKYRNVIRHRREIGGVALAGIAVAAASMLMRRGRRTAGGETSPAVA
jgi:hypothetical protein